MTDDLEMAKADTRKTERRALWVLFWGGVFFVLGLFSYIYAEFSYSTGIDELRRLQNKEVGACFERKAELVRDCYTDVSVDHYKKHQSLLADVQPWSWHIPLLCITLATTLGYSGLIWWGVYQPASRRPMVAISAIGILLQTILFIWLLVLRFVSYSS
ncbi:MAG: hypothetical protein KDK39_12125 [Leptospiraceae bacterium]|nr:hypothetical protein [Leptospiraceae bacterium]